MMKRDRKVRMADPPQTPEADRLRQERDLYRRLLDLGAQEELEPFLREALGLIVEASGARRGYLELRVQDSDEADSAWWMAHDCSSEEVEGIRDAISRGIIAEALGSGQTVSTASALLDPRFSDRSSVKAHRIEAVLCAPIGVDGSLGVVYLQGRGEPGPFTEDDRAQAELFARHLAPLAERLVVREQARTAADPTLPLRRELRLVSIVGRSEALAGVLRQVVLVAPVDVNVLLTGESGTGKNAIARAIHDNGPRATGPFVELNCAALPEALIESELFGSLRGAHSTAQAPVEGKVAAAEGGTLFLDEIGEIPLAAQSKLLQLLQSKEYFPLGGSQPVRADVRVIAATNSDLAEAVRMRRFREDLFYRLQILPIRMPTLAERREDIPDLARHLCASAFDRHGRAPLEFSPGALRALEAAEWPGNVRQLSHAIEAAAIRAAGEGARLVERHHVFPDSPGDATDEAELFSFQEATRRFQRELVLKTLAETGWNVAETARHLDLARSHVYNLIKAFGLEREPDSS
jgi:Nif-specific regulatory protein